MSAPMVPGIAGLVAVLVWFAVMAGVVVGWVMAIVALWRGMKAQESIAATLRAMANRPQ